MARITVEDCLTQENNRFALVLLAAKRTKQILQGSKLLISGAKTNKAVVSSLREIAGGHVRFMSPEEVADAKAQEQREAEERTREAFARLAQPTIETNGSNGESAPSANGDSDSESDSDEEKPAQKANAADSDDGEEL